MKYYLLVAWYYIECLYARLLLLFLVSKDPSVIPEGPYCYHIIRTRDHTLLDWKHTVISCKYYRCMKDQDAACVYTGVIGWDLLLGDQCKVCGIKHEIDL